jgi:hypothetical protein
MILEIRLDDVCIVHDDIFVHVHGLFEFSFNVFRIIDPLDIGIKASLFCCNLAKVQEQMRRLLVVLVVCENGRVVSFHDWNDGNGDCVCVWLITWLYCETSESWNDK